ncbi:hypothetical protein ACOMHN_067155 [Nucella lapillus]
MFKCHLLQEGAPTKDILVLFRLLTDWERENLYNNTHINNEEELLHLLMLRNSQPHHSVESLLMTYPEEQIRQTLLLYVPPIFLVLGTVGNFMSFLVLRCRAMVKISTYHYLACLAIADTVVLYIGLLRLWIEKLTGRDYQDSTDWVCKLTISLGYTASDLSVWLIIAVTVERYIVVRFPLKASSMINTARAKKVILFLVLLMFTINLHFFWTVEIVERVVDRRKNESSCEASPYHEHLVNEVWPWVDTFIYSFSPFIVISFLNFCIIREVLKARNHRQGLQNTPEHHHPHPNRMTRVQQAPGRGGDGGGGYQNGMNQPRRSAGGNEGTRLTVMLLTVSCTFLLTTFPMNVCLIFTAFWNQRQHGIHATAQFGLAKTVVELLMYVNHSVNFCLYCATGHKFRQQIAQLLCCRKSDVSAAWTSVQTEHTRLTSSVRLHVRNRAPNERLLVAFANDELDSPTSSNGTFTRGTDV